MEAVTLTSETKSVLFGNVHNGFEKMYRCKLLDLRSVGVAWFKMENYFLGEKVLKGTTYPNDGNVERRNLPKKFNYILSCIFERFTLQVLSDRLVLTVPLQVKDRLGKMQGHTGLNKS